jgi:hypothetical protein
MSEQAKKTVSDLSIGDQIEAKGFDGVRTVVGSQTPGGRQEHDCSGN